MSYVSFNVRKKKGDTCGTCVWCLHDDAIDEPDIGYCCNVSRRLFLSDPACEHYTRGAAFYKSAASKNSA